MKIHINQLPLKRTYVVLNKKFNDKLLNKLLKISGTIANANRLSGISKSALGRYFRRENRKIRIDFLLTMLNLTNILLEDIETEVSWIGNNQSKGTSKPKLPFSFNSRSAARFLAAICNDGCITNGSIKCKKISYGRIMYNNNEKSLRESVKKDAETIFGFGVSKEFKKRNGFFLVFPSIIRDVIDIITEFKGKKSENNPPIPPFILKDKELMLGWLEQTIADEGHVKYYPETYRREIIWRRSFNKDLNEYKLNIDERKMLEKLGIKYDLKNIGGYTTKKGIEKIRLQMRLSKKENLLKLSKLIRIPDKKKQKMFESMIESFFSTKK